VAAVPGTAREHWKTGLLGRAVLTVPPSLQAAGKSGSTDTGRTHCRRPTGEKLWFLGRDRPAAASAERFAYGLGVVRKPLQRFGPATVLTKCCCEQSGTPNGQNLCPKEHRVFANSCSLLRLGFLRSLAVCLLTGLSTRCRAGARFPSSSFMGLLAGVPVLCRWSLQMSAAADSCLKWTRSR